MLIPESALRLIDEVSGNRTAFVADAAIREAKTRRRELNDAEVARICGASADRDHVISIEFKDTLLDVLHQSE